MNEAHSISGAELRVAALNCKEVTADAKTRKPVEPVSN
jgi:hypothetical protein